MRRSPIARAPACGAASLRSHRLRWRRRRQRPAGRPAAPAPAVATRSSSARPTSPRTSSSPRSTRRRCRPRASNVEQEARHRQPRGLLPGPARTARSTSSRSTPACCCSTSTSRPRRPSPTPCTPRCRGKLPGTLTVLDKSAAEDKDAVVVTTGHRHEVQRHLASPTWPRTAGSSSFGGPPEFKTRPDGMPGHRRDLRLHVQGVQGAGRRRPAHRRRAEERRRAGGRPVHHRPDHRGQGLRRPRGPEEQLRRAERRAADQQGEGEPDRSRRRSTRSRPS